MPIFTVWGTFPPFSNAIIRKIKQIINLAAVFIKVTNVIISKNKYTGNAYDAF